MESPRKFNDCYFYYYSTCTKGDNCVFRHEPSALGCETMCALWQEGKCLDKKCKLRHMELRKNRKQIPCYWETQPGGCRKRHCPFMHKNPEARTDGIAPSQPIPNNPVLVSSSMGEGNPIVEAIPQGVVAPVPMPSVPAPVPLLWQQQRQVVLDSTILGVLPNSSDLLAGRRVLPPHETNPNPYGPMPVDPLVVNFEEESDNETPSSTPTKQANGVATEVHDSSASHQSQELLLLEKIQAEAAAVYGYDPTSVETPKHRKIVRSNLSTMYDRSLDELSGKRNSDKSTSLDFKILSLDEIRAKKRTSLETIVHSTPISVNLSRKRKRSETIVDSANKIIKVVRSNSIVYKKVDQTVVPSQNVTKIEHKTQIDVRKRTVSEFSDSLEIGGDELEDECFQFKKIRTDALDVEYKTPFIITKSVQIDFNEGQARSISTEHIDDSKEETDDEVQIVSEEICYGSVLSDSDVINIEDSTRTQSEIVDLSDDDDNEDVIISDIELSFGKNVPDVVASCHNKHSSKVLDDSVINSIDLLDEDL